MDEKTRANLADAGCSEAFIAEYDGLCGCARICKLKERRRELLDGIHAEQKKLECLDYLIYQLRCEANKSECQ
jgi:hypothetical protein